MEEVVSVDQAAASRVQGVGQRGEQGKRSQPLGDDVQGIEDA